MSPAPKIVEWFRDEPLPLLLPNPAVVLGGSRLLVEFLTTAASFPGGTLSVAVPFVGRAIARHLPPWEQFPHHTVDLTLVTHGAADAGKAQELLGRFPWRSFLIRVRSRLHSKLYSFVGATGGVCLIGSHNLSGGGAGGNHEAGTLFVSRGDPGVSGIIRACHDHVEQLGKESSTFFDSLRWPSGSEV